MTIETFNGKEFKCFYSVYSLFRPFLAKLILISLCLYDFHNGSNNIQTLIVWISFNNFSIDKEIKHKLLNIKNEMLAEDSPNTEKIMTSGRWLSEDRDRGIPELMQKI